MEYEILLVLPTDDLNHQMEYLLKKRTNLKCKITRVSDTYNLVELLKEHRPDLVLVSPIIISDQMIPLLKEKTGLTTTKFISYCFTVLEEQYQKNFDAKININDTPDEIEDVLADALTLDLEQDEEQVLTPREREVVIAVVKGYTNKEIAEELFLSTHTVITHRRNIARKLNIHSPSGLTIYAIINKLVELDDIMK